MSVFAIPHVFEGIYQSILETISNDHDLLGPNIAALSFLTETGEIDESFMYSFYSKFADYPIRFQI